ncbi:MAG: ABC transporter permease [Tepidisphaeraceae bacterium]|jgi:ABC-type transport system involved in multi-copper enzyme maturation permease subunit
MFSLIWKEWHEQRWKLGFGCLVLSALAAIGLRARILPDETMVEWVCFLGLALLPILSSTGLIPAERADDTFESLLALPVAPWRILVAKTLMGLLLCAGPMILAALVSVAIAGNREMSSADMLYFYARSTFTTLSLFIWMLALTAQLPSETRAGLLAMGLLVFWLLATAGLVQPSVPLLAFAVSPFAFVYRDADPAGNAPTLLVNLAVQVAILSLLWLWTTRRLTCGSEGKS